MKNYYLTNFIGFVNCISALAMQTISGANFNLVYYDIKLGLFGAPSVAGNNIFLHRIILRPNP